MKNNLIKICSILIILGIVGVAKETEQSKKKKNNNVKLDVLSNKKKIKIKKNPVLLKKVKVKDKQVNVFARPRVWAPKDGPVVKKVLEEKVNKKIAGAVVIPLYIESVEELLTFCKSMAIITPPIIDFKKFILIINKHDLGDPNHGGLNMLFSKDKTRLFKDFPLESSEIGFEPTDFFKITFYSVEKGKTIGFSKREFSREGGKTIVKLVSLGDWQTK